MFNFGSSESVAQLYFDRAIATRGPKLADKPIDEMSAQQLQTALVYARIAYSIAQTEMQPQEVLNILMSQYDEVFEMLAEFSDLLRAAVEQNKHKYLGGYEKENIEKYRRLAKITT